MSVKKRPLPPPRLYQRYLDERDRYERLSKNRDEGSPINADVLETCHYRMQRAYASMREAGFDVPAEARRRARRARTKAATHSATESPMAQTPAPAHPSDRTVP